MFLDILKFELNYHRKQYLLYVLSGTFFILFFLATTSPNVQIGDGVANVNINSPYTIMMVVSMISAFSMFAAIAFCSNAVIRDFELGTAELFLSRPIKKFDYVYGRYLGSLLITIVIYVSGVLGIMVGELMPWLDAERVGSFRFEPYLYSTLVIGLPNVFIMASLFFFVSTVTRSVMTTYVVAVGLLMLSILLDSYSEKDTVALVSFLDPFGITSLEEATRYWTVFEKNEQLPKIDGTVILNRIIWMSVAVLALVSAYPLFPFSLDKGTKKFFSFKTKKAGHVANKGIDSATTFAQKDYSVSIANPSYGIKTQLLQCLSQTKLETLSVVKSVPFIVILLFGLMQVTFGALGSLENAFGTSLYASTYNLVGVINASFSLALLFVLIYYTAEILVRERSVKVNDIIDSMPFPNWIMIAAKITTLLLIVFCMMLAATIASIGVQLYKGFTDIELLLYAKGLLFFFQIPYYLMIVMAVFFYVVTRSKYITMFLTIVLVVTNLMMMPALGFEHRLYRIGQVTPVYSEFTGYSQNLVPYIWQTLYAGLFGCLLLIAAHLLWPRGAEINWRQRLRVAKQRNTAFVKCLIATFALSWAGVGGFLYYNANILNQYLTLDDYKALSAEYEKRYKQYEHMPALEVSNVFAEVDIYPNEQELRLVGYYDLINNQAGPISALHLSFSPGPTVASIELAGAQLTVNDEEHYYRIYSFDKPVQPGQTVRMDFAVDWLTPGFTNNGHSVKLARNGTFVNNQDFFPLVGYQSGGELQDNNHRRQQGLEPIQRMSKIDDESAWSRSGLGGSRIQFETIVSTSADQTAIAPGYIEKQWVKDDRAYFHYKTDAPIWNYYSFVSADYQVLKDNWQDVAIEIYYRHDYNIDTMVRSTKKSLEYFTKNFSPYQYRQFRIMEFPRFQGRFAQSFPNTIPFSESIGFTADLTDPKKIDYVFYVTAHELAHQWWAHQVLGADVQGSSMIVETLSQYSALMVMEKEYGKEQMKRFLEFELDNYLRGRGGEIIGEQPLYLVENQPYIHYRKGSVVMYALQDYIGEDKVNEALAEFIGNYAFKGAPYPTSKDLIKLLREKAQPEHQSMITDLFEKIVIFDLSVTEANVEAIAAAEYEVSIDVQALKFEADDNGQETEVSLGESWIDIGVFGEKQGLHETPQLIYLEKHRVDQSTMTFKIRVAEKPLSVGIDPLNKLIDRNPEDNVKTL